MTFATSDARLADVENVWQWAKQDLETTLKRNLRALKREEELCAQRRTWSSKESFPLFVHACRSPLLVSVDISVKPASVVDAQHHIQTPCRAIALSVEWTSTRASHCHLYLSDD
jgi:hypothetical protein